MQVAPRSKALGLVVAATAVAAITILIFPLRHAVPAVSTGVLYLLAVLLISTYWGLTLGLITSLASAAAFNFFHIPPTGHFTIADPQNLVALGVYFAAAVVVSTLAEIARGRAEEAEAGRREADLAAGLARIVLGAAEPSESLPEAARRIAESFGLSRTRVAFGWIDSDEHDVALPLVEGGTRVGTLLLPREATAPVRAEIDRGVVPALTALIGAAQRRRELEDAVVETRALRRSDVLKTALLRAVSHDLRTPLTAIRAASSGVASPSLSQEERDEMAALIDSQSAKLTRLVENLLDLSRLEAGGAQPQADWCSVPEVVEAATAGVHEPGAVFDVELEPDLPLVRADSAQLERALANLLENAVRYSDGHPVAVRARADGRRLFIRITDRGPGIAKQDLRHVFEPFVRAGDGTGGAGLGLAIARGFVEANGGRLRAQSLPEQGSTFTIELPLPADAPAQAPAAKA